MMITGEDTFTSNVVEKFSIYVDLSKDNFSIFHELNCVKIIHNDDYYVSTIESLKIEDF